MTADMYGAELKAGDVVVLRCVVDSISDEVSTNECNATLKVMDGSGYKPFVPCVSKSCIKIGDQQTEKSHIHAVAEVARKTLSKLYEKRDNA